MGNCNFDQLESGADIDVTDLNYFVELQVVS